METKLKKLLKLIVIFLVYFIYTTVVSSILNVFGITDQVIAVFIADLLFFLGIVILYKDTIKEGFLNFIKELSLSKKILFIVKWVVILFVINILGGIITEMIFPALAEDGNTDSIYSIASISTLYAIFKTLIFAPIAEELIFKKTVRELISNNLSFIITSSLIYALVNIMYTDITYLTIIDLLRYFVFSSVLSYIYVKNKDNIFMPMLIKFFYNLIPLTILLLGIGG